MSIVSRVLAENGIDLMKPWPEIPGADRFTRALVGRGPHSARIIRIPSDQQRPKTQERKRRVINRFLDHFKR